MNKFKNKIGSNLEKRVFTVEKIETDEEREEILRSNDELMK